MCHHDGMKISSMNEGKRKRIVKNNLFKTGHKMSWLFMHMALSLMQVLHNNYPCQDFHRTSIRRNLSSSYLVLHMLQG